MIEGTLITIPIVASMVLDFIKSLIRENNPDYEFSMNFYKIALPVLQVLVAPVLLMIGLIDMIPDYINFSSWQAVLATAITVLVQSAISVFYHGNVTNRWQEAAQIKKLNGDMEIDSTDFDSVVREFGDRVGDV